jgi:hypothetical protein
MFAVGFPHVPAVRGNTCTTPDPCPTCLPFMKVLRSKCEADVYVEVISGTTGKTYTASGIEAQVRHGCCHHQRGLRV